MASTANSRDNARIKRAVSRLEDAISELVTSAGESAAGHIERAAERVRRQTTAGRGAESDAGYRRRRPREPAWLFSDDARSRKLYRDTERGKLLGVCAGIGGYYGIEPWVVRCVAITGLIFLNWMVVAAYLVASFVLDEDPVAKQAKRPRGRHRARQGRHIVDGDGPSPVDEPGEYPALPPGKRLRGVDADFDEFELRLRRMESHVTSGRYELQRQFRKIGEPPTRQAT